MTSEDALPELTSSVSGTILSLMANLWFAFTQMDSIRLPLRFHLCLSSILWYFEENVSILHTPLKFKVTLIFIFSLFRNTGESSCVTMATVTSLFPQIIKGIISVGGSAPRMRANLYGAFLYYFQIGQMQSSISKEGLCYSFIFCWHVKLVVVVLFRFCSICLDATKFCKDVSWKRPLKITI